MKAVFFTAVKEEREVYIMKRRMRIAAALFAAVAMVMVMSVSAFADGAVIGKKAALNKALKNAGLKKSQVKYVEVEMDDDEEVYEVEFTKKKNNTEYSYDVAAYSGRILEKSVDYRYARNSSHKKIGKTAARKKVADFLNISYKTVKAGSCRYEYDDGEGEYEVKFKKGSRKYECEVLAPTGKVIEYSWEVTGR